MLRAITTTTLLLLLSLAFGRAAQSSAQKASSSNTQTSEGERLFAENCGRCHRPPDQISPKAAGSVLRHMRVRAMLSQEDEQKILKYLNP